MYIYMYDMYMYIYVCVCAYAVNMHILHLLSVCTHMFPMGLRC